MLTIVIRYKRTKEKIGNTRISGNLLFLLIERCATLVSLETTPMLLDNVDNISGDAYLSVNIKRAYAAKDVEILFTSPELASKEGSQRNITNVKVIKGTNVFKMVLKLRAIFGEDSSAVVRSLIINRVMHVD